MAQSAAILAAVVAFYWVFSGLQHAGRPTEHDYQVVMLKAYAIVLVWIVALWRPWQRKK